jgi:hypothetical protein
VGGTGDAPPPARTTSRGSVPDAGERNHGFAFDYVEELKGRLARAARKIEQKRVEARTARADRAAAERTAEERVTAATKAASERIIRAELRVAGLKAGLVDLDGLKLADLSQARLNADGEVEGAEAVISRLKESKPYLFGSARGTSSTEPPPRPGEAKPFDASTAPRAEYEARKRELIAASRRRAV